jgi:dihydrofolate synthase / folylpolyglutamate synthase
MNYQEAISWMFNQLPMYQTQGASAYRKDLDNIILLSNHLGNPEKKLMCIHVAGTNGKGSTSHLLASVLQEAGYKVGLYTSPHLKDYRERIKVNGDMIDEKSIIEFIASNKTFFEANNLSFFEMSVGLALYYFLEQNTTINIIEVGMGGRLDATNIIQPILSIITNIGFDHTQFLGNTIEAIAGEKAGIIKKNIPVVIGEYNNETFEVFKTKANTTHSEIYFASDLIDKTYSSALLGDYQEKNKKTVLQAIKVLNKKSQLNITENNIKEGFVNVISNTGLQGRWQKLLDKPMIICDTAHNSDGLKLVLNQIKNQEYDDLHLVIGFVNDKNLNELLPLFPKKACYYFCKPNIPRGMDAVDLSTIAKEHGLLGKVYNSVSQAYSSARNKAKANDLVFIGGSTFVVAEIL